MNKIIPAFQTTLFDPILSDTVKDFAEIGIDSMLDDELLRDIPIVSTLVGVAKTAQNIHDRNLLKQTFQFINTFNDGMVERKKLDNYRNKLNKKQKFAEKEIERIIIILNSNIDLKKSELLAIFYAAYINEIVNWNEFCELADVTSRLFIADLTVLHSVYKREIVDTSQCKSYQADRLIGLGLLKSTTKSMTIGSQNNSDTVRYIQPSSLGNTYCKVIFDKGNLT